MSEGQIAAAVYERLLDTGLEAWRVSVRRGERGWVVALEHPTGFEVAVETGRHDAGEAVGVIERSLPAMGELRAVRATSSAASVASR